MTETVATIPPKLSIVVISYNTRELTLACLGSVFEQTTTPFELIVVDNASSDGSAEAIRQAFPKAEYPQLTLIAEATNHGFGPAHAVAVPRASAPWLLLLNPDTVVLDGALDKLLAFAGRTPDAGIWGGRTVFADGSLNPASCWNRMTFWSVFCQVTGLTRFLKGSELFNPEAMGGWPRDTERDVDIVSGCLFLIRRSDWDDLGGFDPAFFMYGEEADLCLRARAGGLQPRVTPDAVIVHLGGASEKVRSDKMVRLLRAKTELIKRHFHPMTRDLGRLLFRLWPLARKTGFRLAGVLFQSPGFKEKAETWGEVWARRQEWQNGFSPPRD